MRDGILCVPKSGPEPGMTLCIPHLCHARYFLCRLWDTSFMFYNKPNGMAHFLKHAKPPVEEAVIALLDPDMILVSPLTPYVGEPHLAKTWSRCSSFVNLSCLTWTSHFSSYKLACLLYDFAYLSMMHGLRYEKLQPYPQIKYLGNLCLLCVVSGLCGV